MTGLIPPRLCLLVVIERGLSILNEPVQAAIGMPYSHTFRGFGGTEPYTWELISELPSGWAFNAATGTLSNPSPSTAGSFDITVYLHDSTWDFELVQTFTVRVVALPLVVSGDAPNGREGVAYAGYAYTAVGGYAPYTFVASGLPPGLTLSAGGVLSSTIPTARGDYSIIVTATDSHGNSAVLADVISIDYALLSAAGAFTEGAFTGTLSGSIAITGGKAPYNVVVQAGTPPPGAVFGVTGSTVTETAAIAAHANGAYAWTLRITSADGQQFDVACNVTCTKGATIMRRKITNFVSFDNSAAGTGIGPGNYGGATAYTSGVGGAGALSRTSASGGVLPAATGSNTPWNLVGFPAHTYTDKWSFGAFMRVPAAWAVPGESMLQVVNDATTNARVAVDVSIQGSKWTARAYNSSGVANTATDATNYAAETYDFIVVTYDGAGTISLYRNASLVATATHTANSAFGNGTGAAGVYFRTAIKIAAGAGTTNGFDICKLFASHSCLTANEIAWMFNGGAGRVASQWRAAPHTIASFDSYMLALSPWMYFKLNETSGTTAVNLGSVGAGTYSGSTLTLNNVAQPAGFGSDKAPYFNGGGVVLPNIAGGLTNSEQSIWIRYNTLRSYARFFNLNTTSAGANNVGSRQLLSYDTNQGGMLAQMFSSAGNNSVGGAVVNGSAGFGASTWGWFAATYDQSKGIGRGYINGLQNDTNVITNGICPTTALNSSRLMQGYTNTDGWCARAVLLPTHNAIPVEDRLELYELGAGL